MVNKLSLKDLKELTKNLNESLIYMKKEVQDEDGVIFIGDTKSGKSTLINYLIGNKLEGVQLSRVQSISIRKIDPSSSGSEIGTGPSSETTIPSRWIAKNLPGMSIWDAPGFDDSRGPKQDITNAFYLYQLLQNLKSLRIVLVVDINDILRDKIKPFVSILIAVEDLLGNRIEAHVSALSIIFTKVPDFENNVPVDIEFIKEKLSEQFLNEKVCLSPDAKKIINFLIKSNNHIALFKRAKLGPVTSDIDVNIISVIENTRQIERSTLKELCPSISETSKLCLFLTNDKLFPKSEFVELENAVNSVCEKRILDLESIFKTEGAEKEIKILVMQMDEIIEQLMKSGYHESDCFKQMEVIQNIDRVVKKKIEDNNLLEKIQLVKFVDKLLKLQNGLELSFSLQHTILSSSMKMRNAVTCAHLRLGDLASEKHNEEIQKVRGFFQQKIDALKKKLDEAIKKNNEKKGFWSRLASLFGF